MLPSRHVHLVVRFASFDSCGAIIIYYDAVTATERAYVIMHGMLIRQASMVSFVHIFRLLGIVFLVMLPLVLLMRRPKSGGGPVMAE